MLIYPQIMVLIQPVSWHCTGMPPNRDVLVEKKKAEKSTALAFQLLKH